MYSIFRVGISIWKQEENFVQLHANEFEVLLILYETYKLSHDCSQN